MSRFTAENRANLLVRLESGQSMAAAAASAGIPLPTAKGWLAKGRRGQGADYRAFASAVEDARETATRVALPMDEEELRSLVSAAARKGSFAALKLYWSMLQDGDADPPPGTPSPSRYSRTPPLRLPFTDVTPGAGG